MIPKPKDHRWLALTTFGLGHCRPASGTWGSLPPVAIAGFLIIVGLGPAEAPLLYHGVLIAILLTASAACIVFGEWAEAWFGKKDPGYVVADETAGQCIALFMLPVAAPALTAAGLFPLVCALSVAFVSFRIFDIFKPPPADALQALPAGWGVLIDDLFAGVYALIATQVILFFML